jgi:hypothetical protein
MQTTLPTLLLLLKSSKQPKMRQETRVVVVEHRHFLNYQTKGDR